MDVLYIPTIEWLIVPIIENIFTTFIKRRTVLTMEIIEWVLVPESYLPSHYDLCTVCL